MLLQVNKAEIFPVSVQHKNCTNIETFHQGQKCIFNVFQVSSFSFFNTQLLLLLLLQSSLAKPKE